MATLFKDLGKQANDLLNKGFFEHEKYFFKVDGTLSSQDSKVTPSVQISSDQNFTGSVKTVIPTQNGFTATFTADLKDTLKLELASNSFLRSTLKPTLELSTNAKSLTNSFKFKQTVDFVSNRSIGSSVGITYALASNNPQLNFSVVANRDFKHGVGAFGVEADFSFGKNIPLTLAANFSSPSLTATIFRSSTFQNLQAAKYTLSFYGSLVSSPSTTVGSEIQYDSDGKANIALGANLKLDTSSSVKTKFNSRGTLGLVYNHKVNDSFTVSLLADLNVKEIENPNSAKFGLKVAL